MPDPSDAGLELAVREAAHPLTGDPGQYAALIDLIGDARFVLLGEASHGTHEFYEERAWLTRRPIEEKGFTAVAVEADWPDAYRVNRYVRGAGDDDRAEHALAGFRRFPQWMWRNSVVLDFVEWLQAHNEGLPRGSTKVGFYGLDLYSLHASMDAVIHYLATVDPQAARRARYRYSCFEDFGEDPQAYGFAAGFDLERSCEDEVINQLLELQRRAADYARRDGRVAEDEYFYAEQNARLAMNAERYYRSMFQGRASSWNLRDRHMAETLDALVGHLERRGGRTKVAVWAHNSHLGDARATEMGAAGELNVGQVVRERHGRDAALVGFTTFDGTVTAADDWDDPPRRMRVRPGMPGSYEALFHGAGGPRFLLTIRDGGDAAGGLRAPRLERAIGVIYRPQTERRSHYFSARLTDQFDAVIHIDRTRAVEPLDPGDTWVPDEVPETFPTGV
jgi:erythromycin esterase-like protein